MQEGPPAPAMAMAPGGPLIVPGHRADSAPLHAVLCNLRTRLQGWEEAILPEAERSVLRHKGRGMGMIQQKAKQVRDTWMMYLAQLRRARLEEHRGCLKLLYEEAIRPRARPCPQSPELPERRISREHWLECDDIGGCGEP